MFDCSVCLSLGMCEWVFYAGSMTDSICLLAWRAATRCWHCFLVILRYHAINDTKMVIRMLGVHEPDEHVQRNLVRVLPHVKVDTT